MLIEGHLVRGSDIVCQIDGVLEDVPEAVDSMTNRIVRYVKKHIRGLEPQLIVYSHNDVQGILCAGAHGNLIIGIPSCDTLEFIQSFR